MTEEIEDKQEQIDGQQLTQQDINEGEKDKNGKIKIKKQKPLPKKKYEKVKLRPLNLTAFILALIAGLMVTGLVGYAGVRIFGGLVTTNFNLNDFFADKAMGFTLGLSGLFGIILSVIVYAGLFFLIFLCFYSIFYSIRNCINLGRLLYASDKDYTKNNLVVRSIFRCFVLALICLLLFIYYMGIKTPLVILRISPIVSAILLLAMAVVLIVALIIAKSKFKKSATAEEYDEEILYKKEINKYYFRKKGRRSSVISSWTDFLTPR